MQGACTVLNFSEVVTSWSLSKMLHFIQVDCVSLILKFLFSHQLGRSSHSQMFLKLVGFKNFVLFAEKHLWGILFFKKALDFNFAINFVWYLTTTSFTKKLRTTAHLLENDKIWYSELLLTQSRINWQRV